MLSLTLAVLRRGSRLCARCIVVLICLLKEQQPDDI